MLTTSKANQSEEQHGVVLCLQLRDDKSHSAACGVVAGSSNVKILCSLPQADQQGRIAVMCDGVIDIVAALFNVSGSELRRSGRTSLAVSRVRQIAMYVTHVTLRLSMRDVGQGFGRDRTTVLYACHQVEDMREEEEFDEIIARVEKIVMAAFGVNLNEADGTR